MSLKIWLPLNGSLENKGVSNLKFSNVATSNTTTSADGKIGLCYTNNSASAGGIVSDKIIDLGLNQSVFCWIKFSSLTSASSLGLGACGQHRYPSNTGMGITIKYVSSTTGYLSVNTGDGSNRTYNTYCGKTLLQANNWYHIGYTYDGTTIRLYVNGVLDGSHTVSGMSCPADYFQVFCWSFGATSGNSLYGGYKTIGNINDIRAYNHVLSTKEIKEISRGLVAHYPLRFPATEGTDNLMTYPVKSSDASYDWDASLHPGAINVSSWSAGYNSGVSTPESGYHAYWKIIDEIPTMVFPKRNNEISGLSATRWLGISGSITASKISASQTYTVSFDAKADVDEFYLRSGLYYRLTGATGNAFHDGYGNFNLTTGWKRYSYTYTVSADYGGTSTALYFYGHNGSINGTAYVRNVQFELKDHNTAYTKDSREEELIKDSSGNGNNAISQTEGIEFPEDSARNHRCAEFKGAQYINCGRGPMVTDELTVNWWGYMDDWTLYSSAPMRALSCTEGGGWNFEPSGNYMAFACGTGASANAYKSVTSKVTFATLDSGWHMFTGTWDGLASKIYIDGALSNTNTAYTTKTPMFYNISNAIFIGAEAGSNSTTPAGPYFIGKISDVRIYGTALSAEDILDLYNTPIWIDKYGTLGANEFVEFEGTDKVRYYKTGIVESSIVNEDNNTYSMSFKVLDDGSSWARIHWLDVSEKSEFFTNAAEVAECINKDNRYSLMGKVDNFKNASGVYEFMLTYPQLSSTLYNRWTQTSSPSATTVTGFTAITTAWSAHNAGIRTNGSSYVYNCDSGSTWFAPIGQTAGWTNNSIPGANGSQMFETELWVRVDTLSEATKMKIYNSKYVVATEILEI